MSTNDPRSPSVGDGELPVQPVAFLRPITHPDWLEVCERDTDGAFPVYAAPVGQPAPDLAGVLEALEGLLEAMDMQEMRESEQFHIPQATALGIWRDAQARGRAAITSLRARTGKP
jgi:hypothetical protein